MKVEDSLKVFCGFIVLKKRMCLKMRSLAFIVFVDTFDDS